MANVQQFVEESAWSDDVVVTILPDVCPGDEVTLIGRDGAECITLEELGDLSGRFNYEFVCDLNKRIPRVYVKQK